MSCGKVEICGVDTSTLPVLTNERMRELFPLVHGGDKAAREEFIRGNLRLVLSVIQRFSGRGENVDDLFQVGCIGLIKALDNFDVSQNVRFSTYAVPMIIGEIRRYLRDNSANIELALNTLAEASVTEISKQRRPKGFQQNVKVARSGGSVAKAARTQLEKQLGHSVVSPINAAQVLAAKKTEQIEGEKDKD